MMKNISYSPKFYLRLLVCLILIAIPIGVAQADETATVDDLFKFLIDNWASKCNITVSASEFFLDEPLPGFAMKSNREEVIVSFREKVIAAEGAYGHLPEYWELRSFLDLRPEDIKRGGKLGDDSFFYFRIYHGNERLNPLMLQKALDIDPHRGATKFLMGTMDDTDKYPDGVSILDSDKAEQLRDHRTLLAKARADAAAAEPANAYYPIFEASFRHLLGDDARAMELVKTAASCEYYKFPRIFPLQYALDHAEDFEGEEGVFENIPPAATYVLFMNFYVEGVDSLPNNIFVKNMYKDFIKQSVAEGNWREMLTTLHRAACVMGKGEEYETLNPFVAGTLIHLCDRAALNIAKETGDKTLEAAIVVLESYKHPAMRVNITNVFEDTLQMQMDFVFSALLEYVFDQLPGAHDPDLALVKIAKPPLEARVNRDVFVKLVKPIFESLETFDYSNPQAWYDARVEELFPPEK